MSTTLLLIAWLGAAPALAQSADAPANPPCPNCHASAPLPKRPEPDWNARPCATNHHRSPAPSTSLLLSDPPYAPFTKFGPEDEALLRDWMAAENPSPEADEVPAPAPESKPKPHRRRRAPGAAKGQLDQMVAGDSGKRFDGATTAPASDTAVPTVTPTPPASSPAPTTPPASSAGSRYSTTAIAVPSPVAVAAGPATTQVDGILLGSVFGAVGAMVGAFGGPLGAMIGGGLGALVGGLFGLFS